LNKTHIMPIFESFFVVSRNEEGDEVLIEKTLNLEEVESFDEGDQGKTQVVMKSGNYFVLAVEYLDFQDMIKSLTDGFGGLMSFYPN